jgi:AraC family transcriptional regulator
MQITELATVSERNFPANRRLAWPDRNLARICFVLDGAFTEVAGQSKTFKAGDVVYRPPDTRTEIRFGSSGMRSMTIELFPNALSWLNMRGVLPKRPLNATSPKCVALTTRIAQENHQQDPISRLVTQGLLMELIGEIGRNAISTPRLREPMWLKNIHSMVSREFAAPRSLSDYARVGDVHPTHLARTFRNYYGVSLRKFVRNIRVRNAAKMILSGGSRLADIAAECGFADHAHMTNCFRQCIGMTPSEYRRAAKKS